MSDTEKPKLGMRAPLGIKRTVGTGQVKQSFSHGRQNTVVVEVKRRRILGKPGGRGCTDCRDQGRSCPHLRRPLRRLRPRRQLSLSFRARKSRKSCFARLRKPAWPHSRRTPPPAEEQAKQQVSEEKRRAEDNRKAEEAAVEAARLALEEEARQAALAAEREANAPAPVMAPTPATDDEDRPRVSLPPRREPERPTRGRGVDDRRRSGKLTVSRALDDGEGARARSLAALKRAREKEKRSHMQGGPAVKQVRDVSVPEAITVPNLPTAWQSAVPTS